jgi:hypothetical protein
MVLGLILSNSKESYKAMDVPKNCPSHLNAGKIIEGEAS